VFTLAPAAIAVRLRPTPDDLTLLQIAERAAGKKLVIFT
jgi:hypothetical protein